MICKALGAGMLLLAINVQAMLACHFRVLDKTSAEDFIYPIQDIRTTEELKVTVNYPDYQVLTSSNQ